MATLRVFHGLSRNVGLLATGQALALTGTSLLATTAPLVGLALATQKSLAAVPIAAMFVATLLTSFPAAMLMERWGRRAGFLVGSCAGVLGAATAFWAVSRGSLLLFILGLCALGVFNGFANYFRFAATDGLSARARGSAVSWVLAGGIVAAIAGPSLAAATRDSLARPFAASYGALVAVYLACMVVVSLLRAPAPADTSQSTSEPARPLSAILKQPRFIAAVACSMFGYAAMTLMMTATPLAMDHHGHAFADTAWVIQWHILGMFAPSLVTGRVIERVGLRPVLIAGAVLEGAAVAINLLGTSVGHFHVALLCLGVGWNFLFIGATTLLTETYRPSERARAQGLNDFIVFTTVAAAAITSGVLHHRFGWRTVNLAVIPMLAVVILSVRYGLRGAPTRPGAS